MCNCQVRSVFFLFSLLLEKPSKSMKFKVDVWKRSLYNNKRNFALLEELQYLKNSSNRSQLIARTEAVLCTWCVVWFCGSAVWSGQAVVFVIQMFSSVTSVLILTKDSCHSLITPNEFLYNSWLCCSRYSRGITSVMSSLVPPKMKTL